MRLGILGGTFDPVHVGHLILGETAREELRLDRVLFVPAGQPWRKTDREVTSADHRVTMLRLAIEDNPMFALCTIEVETLGPSYTVATLRRVREENGEAELFLIVGADAFEDMPNWKDPEKITELATIAVTGRPDPNETSGQQLLPSDSPLGSRVVWFHMPAIGVSATAIRDLVRWGKSVRYLLPPVVEAYIRENGLYAS